MFGTSFRKRDTVRAGVSFVLENSMATDWAAAFYESVHWKKTREAFRQYKRGLCEECLKKGIISAGTDVHHIKPLTINNVHDPKVALSWNNLELLCSSCHHRLHEEMREKAQTERKHLRFTVDKNGNVTVKDDRNILREGK